MQIKKLFLILLLPFLFVFTLVTNQKGSIVDSIKENEEKFINKPDTNTVIKEEPINENPSHETEIHKISKKENYETIKNNILSGNYSEINEFNEINLICSTTKGYSDIYDYITHIDSNSEQSNEEAYEVYRDCEDFPDFSFRDIEEIHIKAIKEGKKEAEFLLGLHYPPGFYNSIIWLEKASTWNIDALAPLENSLSLRKDVTYERKFFWTSVFSKTPILSYRDFENSLLELEKSLSDSKKITLLNLAEQWNSSASEETRRDIIRRLKELESEEVLQ